MKNKKNIVIALIMTIISIVYTILVKIIDVKAIGPDNSKVGFSTLNSWFKNLIYPNMNIYKLTEILGLVVILIVAIYALIGFIQLIKRKSIKKVDKEIICLGILYVLMALVYVFFEKFIINYRPILIDNVLEASYPSSHTILAICTCISSIIVSKKYLNKKTFNITCFITVLLLTLVFLGRTISSVHWISDIIGGVIISITLLSYFYVLYSYKKD